MRSCAIEIRDMLTDNSMEMAFTQNEDIIEAFASHTAQEALTDRIGLGCLHRRFGHLNLTVLGDAGKTQPLLVSAFSISKGTRARLIVQHRERSTPRHCGLANLTVRKSTWNPTPSAARCMAMLSRRVLRRAASIPRARNSFIPVTISAFANPRR